MRNVMTKSKTNVGRLDAIIKGLEDLNEKANDLIDAHCAVICAEKPGAPFAMIRNREINNRAGSTVNLIEALRLVRRTLVT
jgi:hypothetical protein